jgi:hypothetical protein
MPSKIPRPTERLFILASCEAGLRFSTTLFPQRYVIWLFPFAFFVPAVFFQRKTAFKFKFLANVIDKRVGAGAMEDFIFRLRPTLLFMIAISTLGVSGVLTTFFNDGPDGAYTISGFFVSGGLGIFTAYLLSLRFPPTVR